jgi:hypothetical protein
MTKNLGVTVYKLLPAGKIANMPSSSAKQHRFMEAVAHNPAFAKKVGISQSVGKDFSAADKGKKFGRGGMPAINKQDTQHGSMDMPFKSLKKFGGMKSGGKVRRFQEGGFSTEQVKWLGGADRTDPHILRRMRNAVPDKAPVEERAITPVPRPSAAPAPAPAAAKPAGPAAKPARDFAAMMARRWDATRRAEPMPSAETNTAMDRYGMKKGGMTRTFGKGGMHKMPDGKMMKDSAMKKSGMPMKDGKPAFMKKMNMGGMAKYAGGGGIESRGKTKGTVIRMASGGSVSARADGIAQRGKTKFKMC